MVKPRFVPDRGDIIWVNFSSSVGREQRGQRPALVLSVKKYNERSGLAIICPVTSKKKGYPLEIEFRAGDIHGVILVDHIISIDWRARRVKIAARASSSVIGEAQEKVALLISGEYN